MLILGTGSVFPRKVLSILNSLVPCPKVWMQGSKVILIKQMHIHVHVATVHVHVQTVLNTSIQVVQASQLTISCDLLVYLPWLGVCFLWFLPVHYTCTWNILYMYIQCYYTTCTCSYNELWITTTCNCRRKCFSSSLKTVLHVAWCIWYALLFC